MALIRITEKKPAASRANARLSKGPTSAAGKEKVSKNACKHHLYARKFLMPPTWAARIDNTIQPCVATVETPAERDLLFHYPPASAASAADFANIRTTTPAS